MAFCHVHKNSSKTTHNPSLKVLHLLVAFLQLESKESF